MVTRVEHILEMVEVTEVRRLDGPEVGLEDIQETAATELLLVALAVTALAAAAAVVDAIRLVAAGR